jgi:hypothetical protein
LFVFHFARLHENGVVTPSPLTRVKVVIAYLVAVVLVIWIWSGDGTVIWYEIYGDGGSELVKAAKGAVLIAGT